MLRVKVLFTAKPQSSQRLFVDFHFLASQQKVKRKITFASSASQAKRAVNSCRNNYELLSKTAFINSWNNLYYR